MARTARCAARLPQATLQHVDNQGVRYKAVRHEAEGAPRGDVHEPKACRTARIDSRQVHLPAQALTETMLEESMGLDKRVEFGR